MDRIYVEKSYWNEAAKDPQVDDKYISDIPDNGFLERLMQPEGKVLEIGCGVGRLMEDGYSGIDISEEMLKIARERKPKCEFKLTDGRTIPYPDESFDVVYCVLVFQHLPLEAVRGYVKEAERVLKKGGKFVFQLIEGEEDALFSKHHFLPSVLAGSSFEGIASKGGHPLWTWVVAHKK